MRCSWAKDKIDIVYHDKFYGKKLNSNTEIFRALSLEIMQIGLSWHIVLVKLKELDRVFNKFNIDYVENISSETVEELLKNSNIIRHKGKINAIINNAKIIKKNNIDLVELVYKKRLNEKELLRYLKNNGFKFIGETTINSMLKAVGVINGHENNCDIDKVGKNE